MKRVTLATVVTVLLMCCPSASAEGVVRCERVTHWDGLKSYHIFHRGLNCRTVRWWIGGYRGQLAMPREFTCQLAPDTDHLRFRCRRGVQMFAFTVK